MSSVTTHTAASAQTVMSPGAPSDEGPLKTLGPADWLSLAAAPTFIAMAVLALIAENSMVLCSADQGMSQLSGMATMYFLMSAFHLAPWLRLANRAGLAPAFPRSMR
jgi:hypothetical protein